MPAVASCAEFPAVLVDLKLRKAVDFFHRFVVPEKNPLLTGTCCQIAVLYSLFFLCSNNFSPSFSRSGSLLLWDCLTV